jgi:hypothetical protein
LAPAVPDLEPERRPVDQDVGDRDDRQGDEDAEAAVATEDDRQRRRCRRRRCGRTSVPVILKTSFTRPTITIAASEFSMIVTTTSWAPVNALRKPGMKPYAAPAEGAGRDRDRDRDRDRLRRDRATDERRDEAAHEHLPGAADVEEAALEPEADGEPGQHERRRRLHRVRQGPGRLRRVDRDRERDRAALDVEEREAGRALQQALVGDDGSRRLSFPWMTLERMIRTAPSRSARTIEMIGTIERA